MSDLLTRGEIEKALETFFVAYSEQKLPDPLSNPEAWGKATSEQLRMDARARAVCYQALLLVEMEKAANTEVAGNMQLPMRNSFGWLLGEARKNLEEGK